MGLIIKGLCKVAAFLFLALFVLLLLLLFIPFGYEGTVQRDEEGTLSIKGRLDWLFGALALGLGCEAGEYSARLSLFGLSLPLGRKREGEGQQAGSACKQKKSGRRKEKSVKEQARAEQKRKENVRESVDQKKVDLKKADLKEADQKKEDQIKEKATEQKEVEKKDIEKEKVEKQEEKEEKKEETPKEQAWAQKKPAWETEKKEHPERDQTEKESEKREKAEKLEKEEAEKEAEEKKQRAEAEERRREEIEKKERARERVSLIQSLQKLCKIIFSFLFSPEGTGALGFFLKSFGWLLHHLLPRKVWGKLLFGREDPAETGMLLGAASFLGGLLSEKYSLDLTPDFAASEDYFLGEVSMRGRVFGVLFLVLLVRILVSKHFWWLLRFVGHVREER